ncbi:Rhodanese domain-containing protein [Amphibalanus amphitrite]|uniref:Rhodanese domain-containing protein n=1 Tax=Amphibalanus amphitrite TaxID=1232801 RepID=A0A6A4WPM9_AMPAM|nr:Rhodanese domain-containing protein [Amphibalanus amphitrite]
MADLPTEMPPEDLVLSHQVSFGELSSRLASGGQLLLLDVRRRDELEQTGCIPRSLNVPLQELDAALALPDDQFRAQYGFPKPAPKDELWVSCRSGRRVRLAVPVLDRHGYNNVKLYLGSFLDWQANGGAVEPFVAPKEASAGGD